MTDNKLREALKRIVGIRGICFEGRPRCGAIDQFDLIHNLAVKALADSAIADASPELTEEMVEGFDSSGPWTAFSTVLYEGREYAMVMQRDRPWFCFRMSDDEPWVVLAAVLKER